MKKNKTDRVRKYTFKDRLPLLLAFVLPVVTLLIIFAGKGIYPFGDQSFLRIDLYHQYAPFHTDLLRRLQGGQSLTYAWDIGLGSNYVALFAYYLSSPFNLLLLIMPASHITEYIGYLAILKTGLAGFTMAWYLCRKVNKRPLWAGFFGVCYAMCGFFAAYNWNIMWLDCLWLAPLVILGLEKLVREGRPFLYCITLALSILTNYYISIMLCMFLVLYFICLMIMEPQKSALAFLGKAGKFALFSLIGGGLAAILLLPAYYALASTASAWSKTTFPTTLTNYFSIFEMLGRHLPLVDCELGLEHWPNIYSGVATLIFLPMYYMNKRINYKEKIVKTVLLLFLLFSFSFNIPNYIWHGLHYPNSLPCRQSFLYTIILLSMCFEGAMGLKKVGSGRIVGIFFGCTAFILVSQKLIDAPEFHYWTFWISLLFVGLYCLLAYLFRTGRLRGGMAFALAIVVLFVETGANMAVTSITITSRTSYWDHVQDYQDLIEEAHDNSLFYRVDKMTRKSKNDGTFIDYNSASIFSSTAHAGISDIYKKLGMEGNTNAYCLTGATPFAESLLSVKYRLSLSKLPESPLYRLAGEKNGAYLYKNLYTLPLGFMISADAEDSFVSAASNPARAQNRLASAMGASRDLLTVIPGTAVNDEYTTSVTQRAHIFAYVENSSVDAVDSDIDGVTKSFSNVKRRYMLDLGYCDEGAEILLTNDEDEKMNTTVYRFDDEAFIELFDIISQKGFVLTGFENKLTSTYLRGSVTAGHNEILMFSIPYEKGWTVKVDGTVTEASSFNGSFLTVPLSSGEHTVELSYFPEGLKTGAFVTLGSAALLLLLFLADVLLRRRRRARDAENEAAAPDQYSDERLAEILNEDGTAGLSESTPAHDGEIKLALMDDEIEAGTDSAREDDADAEPEAAAEEEDAAAADAEAVDAADAEDTDVFEEAPAGFEGEGSDESEKPDETAVSNDTLREAEDLESASETEDFESVKTADAMADTNTPADTGEETAKAVSEADEDGVAVEKTEDIQEEVASQVASIMQEPDDEDSDNNADDLYKTQFLEQLLKDLESSE